MTSITKAAGKPVISLLAALGALAFLFTACPNNSSPEPGFTITGVTVNPSNTTVVKGQTKTFSAAVQGENEPAQSVTWRQNGRSEGTSISSTGVLTVAGDETATTITVTATSTADTSKSGNATVTVMASAVSVTGVRLNYTDLSLGIGQTATLAATVIPDYATNTAVTWSSSDTSKAAVNNGVVTAVAAGTATITVRTADGNKTAVCNVTVVASVVSVTGVSLSPTSLNLTAGQTASLTATVAPANATNQAVTWESSDASKASIDANGLVTAVAPGTATITVKTADGNRTATCAVTISSVAVTGVSLNYSTLNLGIGQTATLTPMIVPANATNTAVTWESSDASKAAVNNGVVTAVAAGTATITVTTADGGHTATCAVTVVASVVSVTGVSLSPISLNLTAGQSANLTATVAPADATNQAVTWESSNPNVASVNGEGRVTASDSGTATITVTTADGNRTATCAVTVTIPVTGVSLSQTSLNLIIGSPHTLTAAVAPANATNTAVTWSSSDTSKATVNQSGLVTAVAPGTATITVTTADGGHTATCAVTVSPALTGTVTITGNPWVGETLTANTSLNAASGLHYQWKSGASNAGSDSASYALTSADLGKTITVVVTATGYSSSVTGGPTAAVTKPTFTSPEALGTWLSARPANTATTPYEVVLTGAVTSLTEGSDALGKLFNNLNEKYVSFDLSAITGTSIAFTDPAIRQNKDKLVSVILPSGLNTIVGSAFKNCVNLAQVSVPSGVTTIIQSAFEGCTNLTQINLPSGLTTINASTFEGCTNLTQINLPAGLATISYKAFKNCTNLALTSLPSNVTTIDYSAFQGCTNLALTSLPSGVTTISQGAFQGCTSLALISLPSGVATIGSNAFMGCTSLALTSLPSGVTTIGSSAFEGCTNLALTSLPSGVSTISGNAFMGCTSLMQITLPSGITSIGNQAFYGCTNLTQIILPSTVITIGGAVFSGCTSLTQVICNATTPPTLGYSAFENTHASLAIKVPSANVSAYQGATNWSTYSTKISAQ